MRYENSAEAPELEADSAYRALSPELKSKALDVFTRASQSELSSSLVAGSLKGTLSNHSFQAMGPDDRGKVLDLYLKSGPFEQVLVGSMLDNGRLLQRDHAPKGETSGRTLDHLHALATGPLVKGIDREALLHSAITETADPLRVTQADASTCTVSSMLYDLDAKNPAEYARLLRGVASPAGTVRMANGDPLTREPGTEKPDSWGRSPSGRLLQASLMEYGNGALDYDDTKGMNVERSGLGDTPQYAGLYPEQAKHVSAALFGHGEFDALNGLGPENRKFVPGTVVGIRNMVQDESGEWVGHQITPLEVRDGRLHFRDPGGSGRRDLDFVRPEGVGGDYSMSLDEFNQRNPTIFLPRT